MIYMCYPDESINKILLLKLKDYCETFLIIRFNEIVLRLFQEWENAHVTILKDFFLPHLNFQIWKLQTIGVSKTYLNLAPLKEIGYWFIHLQIQNKSCFSETDYGKKKLYIYMYIWTWTDLYKCWVSSHTYWI